MVNFGTIVENVGKMGLAAFIGMVSGVYVSRTIPSNEEVQKGYIAPSRLEITCEDLDLNGEPETILHIDRKPYLLREVDGKPVISGYEIKPTETSLDASLYNNTGETKK